MKTQMTYIHVSKCVQEIGSQIKWEDQQSNPNKQMKLIKHN